MILKMVSKTFKCLDSAGMVGSVAPPEPPRQGSGWHPAESQLYTVAIGSRGSHVKIKASQTSRHGNIWNPGDVQNVNVLIL